jgi:nitrile hydratase accessory protein
MTGASKPLPALLGDEVDRAFDAPWQAQAFAIVVGLNKTGYFGWDEWVDVFSQEIARSPARAGESKNDTYYRQWLDALEQVVVKRGLLAPEDTSARVAEWRAAYVNTPHGQAVELAHATCPPAHTNRKILLGVPVTVSSGSSRPNRLTASADRGISARRMIPNADDLTERN